MITAVYIEEIKIDLFKDENIEVVSSVLDITDITKNTGAYSKTFTVPPSKTNNKYFKRWYNANIDNTFDARTKKSGRIEINGAEFKVGKFRLQKVSVKKNRPSSYTINFFGNQVTLKDKVKKDELSALDLTAFDHTYNSTNVYAGLTVGLFSYDIVYNLFAKKQYYYNSDPTDNTQTDARANISYYGGDDAGVIWNDLRPSIRLLPIIEAIETDYDVVFTRDFFGTAEFTNLYMWLNLNKKQEVVAYTQVIDFDAGDSTYMNLTTNIGAYPLTENQRWIYEATITPSIGYTEVPYTLRIYKDGEKDFEVTGLTGTTTSEHSISYFNIILPISYDVYFEVESEGEFNFTTSLVQTRWDIFPPGIVDSVTTTGTNVITGTFEINLNLPKIKIIDFLKGLFQMFKLVVIPQDNGDLYVNTLDAYYADGTLYDITPYVDFASFEAERGKLLNIINFKFKEPKTILNIQFEKNNGLPYGDEETILLDDNDELLDGEALEVTVPFEQVVYERLYDQDGGALTKTQYGAIIDENLDPTNIDPHIFYNIPLHILGSKTVGFITDTGTKLSLVFLNMMSHTNTVDTPTFSTVFSREFSTYYSSTIENTLYKNHWENYINSIFDIKKRTFKYKANLPLQIISKLELNDVLQIQYNYFRPDNFNHNLLTDNTQLSLINTFDNTINRFGAYPEFIITDHIAKSETSTVTDLTNSTYAKVDTGDGVAWVTVTDSEDILTIAVSSNSLSTDSTRSMIVRVTQTATSDTIDINVLQGIVTYLPKFDFSDNKNSQYMAPLLTLRT